MSKISTIDLSLYSDISETPVEWLWYPYIPFGKLTVLQGDPGNGKSTLMMNIIAAATTSGLFPDGKKSKASIHVIYQCSEDGIADTIKPRLLSAGADCQKIAFIKEELEPLSIADDRLRRAISYFGAKLLVIDPIQAYLGNTNISNATGVRKLLKQLASWASEYDCAVVLIGHLNKNQTSRDLYRSLGSIDMVANARSVLEIDKDDYTEELCFRHIKSSLAPRADGFYFKISSENRIQWLRSGNESIDDSDDIPVERITKQLQVETSLMEMLSSGPLPANTIMESFKNSDVCERTVMRAKRALSITSTRKGNFWYWQLPTSGGIQE